MNQTIVIDTKTGNEILEVFRTLRDEVSLLRETISATSYGPKYGTDLWWEKMDKTAMRDVQMGLGLRLENTIDIDNFFKNLQ